MMSRSTLFGLVVFVACEILHFGVAVAQPSPPFKVFIQEEFFNTKLRLHHLGPFDTINVHIGKVSYKIPAQTPFYFRPSSDSVTITIDGITQASIEYTGQMTIRRTPDSLVILTPEGNPFIPNKVILLRIPRYLKGHLYWFNPYARKGQSVLEVQPIYERALNAIGAAHIELPPGDYGWFTLQRDSLLRLKDYTGACRPVMFFSYFGPEEILSWTVRKTARDMAKPADANLWVDIFSEPVERDIFPSPPFWVYPDPDSPSSPFPLPDNDIDISNPPAKIIPQQELDTVMPLVGTRIFYSDLFEVRNSGEIRVRFSMQGLLPGNAKNLRCRARETDERIIINLSPMFPRGPATQGTQPLFKSISGECFFTSPSDTFDMYITNMAETATFRIMLDSTTLRIARNKVNLVVFKSNVLWRDPLDMVWVLIPEKALSPLRSTRIRQVLNNCSRLGARLILMPEGHYSTREGIKRIEKDSVNALIDRWGSSRVLFYHYRGPRETIQTAVNGSRKHPIAGEQGEFTLYFGPRS